MAANVIQLGSYQTHQIKLVKKNKVNNINQVINTDDVEKLDSFHEAFKFIYKIVFLFPVFPVYGALKSTEQVQFKWMCVRTFYCIIFIFFGWMETFYAFMLYYRNNFQFNSAGAFIFNIFNILSTVLFFSIAMNWKRIINYWKSFENVFLLPPYSEMIDGKSLTRKIQIVATLMFAAALGEFDCN